MLTIVIGIVTGICLVFLIAAFDKWEALLKALAAIVMVLALFLGLNEPLSGYNPWELQNEIHLVSFSNYESSDEELVYVAKSAEDVYVYRYEIELESKAKDYRISTVSRNVEEDEDPNCKVAVLREFKRTPKRSIWTFALGSPETKYVFYVPEGTISEDIELG